ncbi:GTP-binding protein [Nonlabens sp.]|uniref:GTP-binding protein n=1 Tax=Nonlabens sp. TaxID=1888209 RepID=UPI003F6A1974
MSLTESIPLRPRFSEDVDYDLPQLIQRFKKAKSNRFNHKISISENHIFLSIAKTEQHFWSPQLHLEIREENSGNKINGLFGPNPTVWTMFMFLHFIIGTLFIGSSIWGYTIFITKNSYLIPILLNTLLMIIWLLFYIAGRIGKRKARPQMNELYSLFKEVLSNIN